MKRTVMSNSHSYLPFDVALKIASFLEVFDLCALGSCSRFWRDLCRSDCLWELPTKERWPSWPSGVFNRKSSPSASAAPIIKGWKEIYTKMHREMASTAATVIELVQNRSSSQSLDILDFYRALLELKEPKEEFAFKDVQVFFFKPNLNVLVNLVGLHYCILCLGVPARSVCDALHSCKISERQVYVKWWKPGRWVNGFLMRGRWVSGFQMRDRPFSCRVSLADLTTKNGWKVLYILRQGLDGSYVKITISNATTTTTTSCQISQ